jgi:hypothetical protein
MGNTDASLLSSSSYQINLYDHNLLTSDQLITIFNLTSTAIDCRTYCLDQGYTYKTSPFSCRCPSVTLYSTVNSQSVSMTFTPVMWFYIDSTKVLFQICLPIILGLSFIAPILEKIIFSKNSHWKYVPLNILYL